MDNLKATRTSDTIALTWRRLPDSVGTMDVWLANTNYFRTGQNDAYQKVATVNVETEHATIPLPPSDRKKKDTVYKLALKASDNWSNTWVPGN